MAVERYGIATYAQGVDNIVALIDAGITQEPRGEWSEEGQVLADVNIRYSGNPIATWIWDFIRPENRTALRAYCTGASEELYIQTVDNEGVFDTYRVIMRWPDEKIKAGWSRDIRWTFRVEFLILEQVDGGIGGGPPSA